MPRNAQIYPHAVKASPAPLLRRLSILCCLIVAGHADAVERREIDPTRTTGWPSSTFIARAADLRVLPCAVSTALENEKLNPARSSFGQIPAEGQQLYTQRWLPRIRDNLTQLASESLSLQRCNELLDTTKVVSDEIARFWSAYRR